MLARKFSESASSRDSKKYELLNDDRIVSENGAVLYRIRSLREFFRTEAGELGGYIQSEQNLDHHGGAWVAKYAQVFGDAKITEYARITDEARVFGKSIVGGFSVVRERACIHENALVDDKADVSGHACVRGRAVVSGRARVSGTALIDDNACVFGNVIVRGAVVGNQSLGGSQFITENGLAVRYRLSINNPDWLQYTIYNDMGRRNTCSAIPSL